MSDDIYLEMTCTGAEGEWWMALDIEGDMRRCLEELAGDHLEEFGFGDGDAPGCRKHGSARVTDCEDCFDEYQRHYVDKARERAARMVDTLAPALKPGGEVTAVLGRERVTFRLREMQ